MVKYDCTLEGIRIRAENRRAMSRARDKELAKYESIHKNPVENRNGIQTENGTGIDFTLLHEILATMIFCLSVYFYWFVN